MALLIDRPHYIGPLLRGSKKLFCVFKTCKNYNGPLTSTINGLSKKNQRNESQSPAITDLLCPSLNYVHEVEYPMRSKVCFGTTCLNSKNKTVS